jgi:ABC-type cobalamin transport system permease subunit
MISFLMVSTIASVIIWAVIIAAAIGFVGGFIAGILRAVFGADPRTIAGNRRANKEGKT